MATPRFRRLWDGQRLVQDLDFRRWNQAQLAEKAGVSQVTVSRAVHGSGVSAKTMDRIARALGQRLDRYYLGLEERKSDPAETSVRDPLGERLSA